MELQLNKANTSDKETSFFDLNIKVIGNDVHTSVYDKCDNFGFPIVDFTWLSSDVPRLPSYGVYISQLVRFAECCTSVSDFNSSNLHITSKLLKQGSDIASSESKIEKVPRGIRGEKSSKDMASSRNLALTIGAQASPTIGGRNQVSGRQGKRPLLACHTRWECPTENTHNR